MSIQNYDMAALAQTCAHSDPARGADGVLAGLGKLWPELSFRTVLTRGGWYRSGGVVDTDKRRVADSIRVWAEQNARGDVQRLTDSCLQTQLFATRLLGKTHYLTAQTGQAAADFMQLEVEELQEVLERYLSDPDWLPDSVEEFIDPLNYAQMDPEPVGTPRLVFRRFFSAREMINPLESNSTDNLIRFMHDWDRSSATRSGHFCNWWVLAVREYTDSDGDPRITAQPVPASAENVQLSFRPDASGAKLANCIHGYDHHAGYAMAWFFHMVASAGVPHSVGLQVVEDHSQGFDYLPARDLELLRDWASSPYRV